MVSFKMIKLHIKNTIIFTYIIIIITYPLLLIINYYLFFKFKHFMKI